MNINNIIKRKIEERKDKDIFSSLASTMELMPKVNFIYPCVENRIPVIVNNIIHDDRVSSAYTNSRRDMFWEEVNQSKNRISYWSYDKNEKQQSADANVDFYIIQEGTQDSNYQIFLADITSSDDKFVQEFASRFAEISLAQRTCLYERNSINFIPALDSFVNKFLKKHHSLPLSFLREQAYGNICARFGVTTNSNDNYDAIAESLRMGEIDLFNATSSIYLGILASMSNDKLLNTEYFFSKAKGLNISPLKSASSDRVLDYLERKLTKYEE